MNDKITRIAMIGPESSGKTTLAKKLAEFYNTLWVPEFARSYVENLTRPYNREDILICARSQWESEREYISQANNFLFSDTEMINCKVWLKDVYNDEDEWINSKVAEQDYALYLLMYPDLPFVDDPVRENKNRREFFFDWYKRELMGKTFEIISGTGENRLQNAIHAINKISL